MLDRPAHRANKLDAATWVQVLALLMLALGFVGCGAKGTTGPDPDPVPVASVVVTPGTPTLAVGGTVQLAAVAKDANGSVLTRTVTWSSGAPGVATVSGTGLVTAVTAGNAQITATAEGVAASAAVTVQSGPSIQVTISLLGGAASSIPEGVHVYPAGTNLAYSFQALTGYSTLTVLRGGTVVAASGSIVLTGDVTLTAGAAPAVPQAILNSPVRADVRRLLTDESPMDAFRDLMAHVASRAVLIGPAAAQTELRQIIGVELDPVADGAAFRVANAKIADSLNAQELPGIRASGVRNLFAVRPSSSALQEDVIIYVNGILTSALDAQYTAFSLLTPIARSAGFTRNVRPFYNASGMGASQVDCTRLALLRLVISGGLSAGELLGAEIGCIRILQGTIEDLSQSARQAFSAGYTQVPETAEAEKLASQVRELHRLGHRVILVGHSQGNLHIEEVLRILRTGAVLARSECVAVVSIASPYRIIGGPSDLAIQEVVAEGTVATDVLRVLGLAQGVPHIRNAMTNLFDQQSNLQYFLPRFSAGVVIHSIDDSYIWAPETSQWIKAALIAQRNALNLACPNVGEVPVIGASPASANFMATAGASLPVSTVLNISNVGTGTLSGLSVGAATYGQGEQAGWLAAPVLSGPTDPATLSLRPSTTDLPAGTYQATVPILATGNVSNSPLAVIVTYVVTAAPPDAPTIELSSAVASFSATVGGADPQAQNITITNAGTGLLSDLTSSVSYQAGQPTDWISAVLNTTTATATLTLAPTVGALAAGTYNATIAIASSADGVTNSPQLLTISLIVSGGAHFVQQGPKLVGSGAVGNALQGQSVSISGDGDIAIVGGNDDNNRAGAAWIWTKNGGVWSQLGSKLVGSGAAGPAEQGIAVAISADGNTAIVGGAGDNVAIGAVWIWVRNGATWTQQGPKLVGSGVEGAGAYQGRAVSLSADGNTALVGGFADNNTVGAVWVWTRSGGVWTQQGAKLVASDGVGASTQGVSVSLSADGNTALVGGFGDNDQVGAAWIWTRSGGVWTQQGSKLVGSGTVGHAWQGQSVSLSGDGQTAIVGGWSDANEVGAAWIWTRIGGAWTQQGTKLVGSGALGVARQGSAVSLSGDGSTAIVGGWYDNNNLGASWIWTRNGTVWSQQGTKLLGSGAVGIAAHGYSVALSTDGRTAIVGGVFDNGGAGAAWVFTTP